MNSRRIDPNENECRSAGTRTGLPARIIGIAALVGCLALLSWTISQGPVGAQAGEASPGSAPFGADFEPLHEEIGEGASSNPRASTLGITEFACTDGRGVIVASPILAGCAGGSGAVEVTGYSKGTLVVGEAGRVLIVTHGHGRYAQRRLRSAGLQSTEGLEPVHIVRIQGVLGVIYIPAEEIFGEESWIDEERSDGGTTYIVLPPSIEVSALGIPVRVSDQEPVAGTTIQFIHRIRPDCLSLEPDCTGVAEGTIREVGRYPHSEALVITLDTDVYLIYPGSSGAGVYLDGELIANVWGSPLSAAVVE